MASSQIRAGEEMSGRVCIAIDSLCRERENALQILCQSVFKAYECDFSVVNVIIISLL